MIKNIELLESKRKYIDFISQYSFVEANENMYDKLKTSIENTLNIEEKAILLGLLISITNKSQIEESQDFINSNLFDVYGNYIESIHFNFLDFILSQDFGKTLSASNNLKDLIFEILCTKDAKKASNELSGYILKIICASEDINAHFSRKTTHSTYRDFIFSQLINLRGRTGGLIKETGFQIRRLPICNINHIDSLNIFDFFEKNKFDSQLKYSAYCIISKIFSFNSLNLVKLLLKTDRKAAEMIFSTQNGSEITWRNIQKLLSKSRYSLYNTDINKHTNLQELFKSINDNKNKKFKNRKTVGVILTTNNPDIPILEESIKSILNQTLSNIFLCIVDDNSSIKKSQNIKEIVNKLNDKRIILYKNEKNIGQYLSRNIAIKLMGKVDFYAIQDDDDISHPERLEIQLNHMQSNPKSMICLAQQVRFDLNLTYIPDRTNPLDFDFSPASSFFRKDLIKKIGFFMNVRSRGDVEFINRTKNIINTEAVSYIRQPLYLMRSSLNTVSSMRDFQFKTQIDVYKNSMRNTVRTNKIQHALNS